MMIFKHWFLHSCFEVRELYVCFKKHIWHTVIASCYMSSLFVKKMLFVCNLNGVLSPLTWKWNEYFKTCKASKKNNKRWHYHLDVLASILSFTSKILWCTCISSTQFNSCCFTSKITRSCTCPRYQIGR